MKLTEALATRETELVLKVDKSKEIVAEDVLPERKKKNENFEERVGGDEG